MCENGSAGCASGLLASFTLNSLSQRTGVTPANGTASVIGYDLASRMTSLTQDVSGTAQDLSRTFTYNLASQLSTRATPNAAYAWAAPIANRAYGSNKLNQYSTVGGTTFTYDANGNLTSDGSRTFSYDVENRLLTITGSASPTLTYDPLGRLRQTTAGATTTDFLYDGDRLIAEYNGSTLLRRYAHGPGVDEPVVWYEGATLTDKRWLHPDERGSIVATSISSGAGTVYTYGPYGEPAGESGQPVDLWTGSRFRYTGQIALHEARLYYYKARVYDPGLGRFLQVDPVGYKDDLNLYAYVYNDPLNRTDPLGLYECKGSRSDCAAVARFVAAVNTAASKLDPESDAGKKVSAAVRYLGKAGDKNGVTVNATKLTEGTLAQARRNNTIDIDVKQASALSPGYTQRNDGKSADYLQDARGGSSLAHEARHELDAQRLGWPTTKAGEYRTELNAYQTKAGVHAGLEVDGGLSTPADVATAAQKSTDVWCSGMNAAGALNTGC